MINAYDTFQKLAENNKQLYALLRFVCRVNSATAIEVDTYPSYDSAATFIAAKCPVSRVYTLKDPDADVVSTYKGMADNFQLDFTFEQLPEAIDGTDLLYLNTPAEGQYRATELEKYAPIVKKYIVLNNTVSYGLSPSPNVQLSNNLQPVGLVFGINHFIQKHDNWFILEHDDLQPGITILVNKDNVSELC